MPPFTFAPARAVVLTALLFTACALSLTSCLGPGYGGRAIDVELNTKPQGATAYVLHEDKWAKSGQPLYVAWEKARGKPREQQARKELFDWLETHRLRERTTPVKCTVSSHHQVFVARRDPEADYMEFDPVVNKAPCLEFKSHD